MKKNIETIGLVLAVIGSLNIYALVASETKAGTSVMAQNNSKTKGKMTLQQETRERKIPISDAASVWGYYGVTPESPDQKRLCYALFPGVIDLPTPENYPVRPVELWVCNMDGSGHRMLFKGKDPAHNGLQQSWVDDNRIVFSDQHAVYIVNANTGKIEFGPFQEFYACHFALNGKVLMYPNAGSSKQHGLYELDTTSGKMRLVVPHDKRIDHTQYSPNGQKALFTTNNNRQLVVADLESGDVKIFPGIKPMHFQWFDNQSFFGYTKVGVVGVDSSKHLINEMYRWNMKGQIIEHLAGHGCHGAGRADGKYFAGESWYKSDPIVLRLYSRGQSKALVDVFSHSFVELTWGPGGRHHVNPSFSRDGMRLYYNKAVNRNTSYAFSYDLTGLVSPLQIRKSSNQN